MFRKLLATTLFSLGLGMVIGGGYFLLHAFLSESNQYLLFGDLPTLGPRGVAISAGVALSVGAGLVAFGACWTRRLASATGSRSPLLWPAALAGLAALAIGGLVLTLLLVTTPAAAARADAWDSAWRMAETRLQQGLLEEMWQAMVVPGRDFVHTNARFWIVRRHTIDATRGEATVFLALTASYTGSSEKVAMGEAGGGILQVQQTRRKTANAALYLQRGPDGDWSVARWEFLP